MGDLFDWWAFPVLAMLAILGILSLLGIVLIDVFGGRWYVLRGEGPLASITVQYRVAKGTTVSPQHLARAFTLAYSLLAEKGPWRAVQLWQALSTVYIVIWPREPWHLNLNVRADSKSREARTIYVGKTARGLFHELTHLIERQLDGCVDVDHKNWAARGIQSAFESYAMKLGRPDA
jgi:hypothetical protein